MRKSWTKEELEQAIEWRKQGKTCTWIAWKLDRSYESVRTQLRAHNVHLTPEQIKTVFRECGIMRHDPEQNYQKIFGKYRYNANHNQPIMPKNCKHCGKNFMPNKYDAFIQMYCSDTCRYADRKKFTYQCQKSEDANIRLRNRIILKEDVESIVCPCCDKEFYRLKNDRQMQEM